MRHSFKYGQLLPILREAGYVAVDDEAMTWWFTDDGVRRAAAIEDGHE
jgi:hypothetical protein